MEELTFKIQNKLTLKKKTRIRAIYIQDRIIVNIEVLNAHKDNVEHIKDVLIKEHSKLANQIRNGKLEIGSII